MKKEIFKVDLNGFIIESYVGEFDSEGNLVNDIKECVTTSLPQPLSFYKPRWNGYEWVEGESEEEKTEREAQQLLELLKPSPSEIADAELEIKVITMLTELEVVQ